MKRRRLAAILIIIACTAPSAFVARHAVADADDEPKDEPAAHGAKPSAPAKTDGLSAADAANKRREVLAAMSHDDAVLINVSQREMPASPDVLDLGRKGARALARCVSDNVDDTVRTDCANLLGRVGDRAGLAALQGALEAWNPAVRGAAIGALRKMPDRSSTVPLIRLLSREDEAVDNRAAALSALGVLSDPKAVPVLERALNGDDPAVRTAAFRGLWKSRHLVDRRRLLADVAFALGSEVTELALAATFAASELRSPELANALMRLMQTPDVRVRNRAVYALGKIGGPGATRALLAQLPKVRESRMLNNIAFALERLDAEAFYNAAEKDLVSHKQAHIRMNAAFVLGDVRRPQGLPLLEKALGDSNHAVRLAAITAIGKLEAPDGAKLLERFVVDPDPAVSRAAIYGIYALSDDKRTDLVHDKLFANPARPQDRLDAALALGRAKDPRAEPDLIACLEQQRCRLADVEAPLLAAKSSQVPGRVLLSWVKGRGDLTDLVGRLHPPSGAALAVSASQSEIAMRRVDLAADALDLAGDLGDTASLNPLAPLLGDADARVRFHAAVALARPPGGDGAAEKTLFAEIDNMPHERLPHAASVLARVHEPEAQERLLPALLVREKGADPDIAMCMAAVHLAWAPEAAFFRMLDALASPSRHERDLAEQYLVVSPKPIVTELVRRAMVREGRDVVKGQLRRILDLRGSQDR